MLPVLRPERPEGESKPDHHQRTEDAALAEHELEHVANTEPGMGPIGICLGVRNRWKMMHRVPDEVRSQNRKSDGQDGHTAARKD